MSIDAASPLRQRMIEDMKVRNFIEKTGNDYIRQVWGGLLQHHAPPRRDHRQIVHNRPRIGRAARSIAAWLGCTA